MVIIITLHEGGGGTITLVFSCLRWPFFERSLSNIVALKYYIFNVNIKYDGDRTTVNGHSNNSMYAYGVSRCFHRIFYGSVDDI